MPARVVVRALPEGEHPGACECGGARRRRSIRAWSRERPLERAAAVRKAPTLHPESLQPRREPERRLRVVAFQEMFERCAQLFLARCELIVPRLDVRRLGAALDLGQQLFGRGACG